MRQQDDGILGIKSREDAPLYQQLQQLLRGRIEAGAYALGATLPTEAELCREFGVSRHTMRESLRPLVQEGLLTRRPRTGTVVTARHAPPAFVQTIRSTDDLFQMAMDTRFTILAQRRVAQPPAGVAAPGDGPWHRIDGIRTEPAEGTPICFTSAYIPGRLAWLLPALPAATGPYYALLAEQAAEPILDVAQDIVAGPLPARAAAALGRPPRAIGLCLTRRYSSAQGLLIASVNWHPAERFVYRMQLTRPR